MYLILKHTKQKPKSTKIMTSPVWPNGQGASPPKEEITGSSPVMGIRRRDPLMKN